MSLAISQLRRMGQSLRADPDFRSWVRERRSGYAKQSASLRRALRLGTAAALTDWYLHVLWAESNSQSRRAVNRDTSAKSPGQLKRVLRHLLEEQSSLRDRLDDILDGSLYLRGFGAGIATEILMLRWPDRYCLLNNSTKKGLKEIGWYPAFPWGSSSGEKCSLLLSSLENLRRALGARDFMEVDLFLYLAWIRERVYLAAKRSAGTSGRPGSKGHPGPPPKLPPRSRKRTGTTAHLSTRGYICVSRKQARWVDKAHDKLSNDFMDWLAAQGSDGLPSAGADYHDLDCVYSGRRYLFEVKVVRADPKKTHREIRSALGQLMDYSLSTQGKLQFDHLAVVLDIAPDYRDLDWIAALGKELLKTPVDVFWLTKGTVHSSPSSLSLLAKSCR